MARVKNTMKLIDSSIGCIDDKYDMTYENMEDIRRESKGFYDLVCNSFRFGYMQGMKAARAEVKKNQIA